MFDQYVKLFNIMPTIEAWMVEAIAMVLGGFILAWIVCKVTECFGRDK